MELHRPVDQLPTAPSDPKRRRPILTDLADRACGHCAVLGRFLADPTEPSRSLRAAQPVRSHVESTIANSRCDVDTLTERRGSPHVLICTKNQASHERRVAQRKQDLADIETLEA